MSDSTTQVHDENEQVETPENETVSPENASPPSEEGQFVSKAEHEAVQVQAAEYLDGWKRARAEFDNYKKRVEREMKDTRTYASADVLKAVIPVIDDFERAMQNVPEDIENNPWVNGVGMMLRKLHKLLEDQNVSIIDPTGEPFDPHFHEAVGMDDSSDAESGTVTVTMQKGYVLGERVLRPALVRVAQ